MKELIEAIKLLRKYDAMDLDDCIIEFQNHTNQIIPKEISDKFKTLGLSNTDFLTSDYLNNFGFKNLLQYEKDVFKELESKSKNDNTIDIELSIWNNVNEKMPDTAGFYLVIVTDNVALKRRGNIEISDCYETVDTSSMKTILKFQDYVTHWMKLPEMPSL